MDEQFLDGFRTGWRTAARWVLGFRDATADWSTGECAAWLQRLEHKELANFSGSEPYSKYTKEVIINVNGEDYQFFATDHDMEEAEYERTV